MATIDLFWNKLQLNYKRWPTSIHFYPLSFHVQNYQNAQTYKTYLRIKSAFHYRIVSLVTILLSSAEKGKFGSLVFEKSKVLFDLIEAINHQAT